jgi:hypothetical protein
MLIAGDTVIGETHERLKYLCRFHYGCICLIIVFDKLVVHAVQVLLQIIAHLKFFCDAEQAKPEDQNPPRLNSSD